MLVRQQIIEQARSFKGVRWKHQGRTKKGIDCVGLVVVVLNELGANIQDKTDYGRRPNHMEFIDYFTERGGLVVSKDNLEIGDIMLFRENLYPCHATFYSQKRRVGHIIHAHAPKRCVVEEPLTDKWLKKLVCCISIKGAFE